MCECVWHFLGYLKCKKLPTKSSLLPSILPCLSDVMPSAQADKTGTMLSDGAIYSSIDFTTKGGFGSPSPASQATPYATTQILHSNSIHELAVDLPEAQWKTSLQAKQEMASLGYSLPDKNSCNNSESCWRAGGCVCVLLHVSLFLCSFYVQNLLKQSQFLYFWILPEVCISVNLTNIVLMLHFFDIQEQYECISLAHNKIRDPWMCFRPNGLHLLFKLSLG